MLNPLGDRVIIRRDEPDSKIGEIFVPDNAKQPPIEATVIAVGPGLKCPDNGVFIPTVLRAGQRVMVGPYAGIEVPLDVNEDGNPEKHIILRENEVLGTLEAFDSSVSMNVEEIARFAHEVNRAYCTAIGDNSHESWSDSPQSQRDSLIAGVKFHRDSPEDVTPEESHESWLADKRSDGWVYGPKKDVKKKEHPCFVEYADLPVEQRAKDHLFKSIVGQLLGRVS